jgi:peroxin-2
MASMLGCMLSRHTALPSALPPHLPPSLGRDVGGRPWELQVLRSSQLDAQMLDRELTSMLHEQFMRIFSCFKQGVVARMEPELNAVLMLLVYSMSVWRGKSTPGSQMLNLRYRNEWAKPKVGANLLQLC